MDIKEQNVFVGDIQELKFDGLIAKNRIGGPIQLTYKTLWKRSKDNPLCY